MLFNSYEFLFAFMPLVFGGFLALSALAWHRAGCIPVRPCLVVFLRLLGAAVPASLTRLDHLQFSCRQVDLAGVFFGQNKQASRLLFLAVSLNLLLLAYYQIRQFPA